MKIEKKHIAIALIGLITITGAIFYAQYRRIMDYVIKFKGVKIKTLSGKNVNFDLFLSFTNKSDIKFEISEQEYKVYLNDKFVTKIVNYGKTIILPKSTSVLGLNIAFNPSDVLNILGENITALLVTPEKMTLKADIKLKVSLYGIKFSIPYTYTSTIKSLLTPTKIEE